MKKATRKLIPFVLIIAILVSTLGISSLAAQSDVDTANAIAAKIADWQTKNSPGDLNSTDINGDIDWSAFANARAGFTGFPDYLQYINAAVSAHYGDLYLSDLARIALAVGANGGDANSVGGHDLIAAIAATDFSSQTYTASISYALLALNSMDYGEQTAADALVQILLPAQRADGGFNYLLKIDPANTYSNDSDVDTTAMVLQALAPYAGDTAVDAVIAQATAFIKAGQMASGGFGSVLWGESPDSTSMALTALCALGVDPLGTDYVVGGKTILDAAAAYQNADGGIGSGGTSNTISSFEMLYALNAYIRFAEDSASLFDFSDVVPVVVDTTLPGETTVEDTSVTVDNHDIPNTGTSAATGAVVLLLGCAALTVLLKKRKNDEQAN